MAIEVFNRYENKYQLSTETFERVRRGIADYMEPDSYNRAGGTYSVTNLYYDTPDSHLIRTSLAKPSYKEKVRIRAYGNPSLDTEVYAEIKKKVSGLVNKRRSAMTLEEAYRFFATGTPPTIREGMNPQVLSELQYLLGCYELQPALYLAYDRCAYFGVGQHDLRVSFDTNLRARGDKLAFGYGDGGDPLLPGGTWLMEIKVARSIPVWLARLLSENNVYPTSFSKYGTYYQNTLRNLTNSTVSLLPAHDTPKAKIIRIPA